MKETIQLIRIKQSKKILCDECGHEQYETLTADKIRLLIGLRCPECNAVMITHQDYQTYKMIEKTIKIANIVFLPIKLLSLAWCKITGKKEIVKVVRYNSLTGTMLSKEQIKEQDKKLGEWADHMTGNKKSQRLSDKGIKTH